ncbi:MAG: hypothetical protein ABI178_10245 [Rhodanobacter sp.]
MPAISPGRRIAFATSADLPEIQSDDAHLADALKEFDLEPVSCVWNEPAVDWSQFEAVLIRTIWDYYKHHAAFLAWLDQLDRLGVPTINDSRLLRWNSDKRYLLELAQLDIAVIPTRLTGSAGLPDLLASMPTQQLVIKPTVSGGAWQTLRGRVGDTSFMHAIGALPAQLDYLVQPFVPEIASAGEWSLLYFAGEFSHAVLKRPAAGDYRVQSEHGGSTVPARPGDAILAAAAQALTAVTALGYGKPAYARVDGVIGEGRFLLMELELIEPFLFLADETQAAERFARQLAARLDERRASGTAASPISCHDAEAS